MTQPTQWVPAIRPYQRPTLAHPNGNQDRVLAYNRGELPRWDKQKQCSLEKCQEHWRFLSDLATGACHYSDHKGVDVF